MHIPAAPLLPASFGSVATTFFSVIAISAATTMPASAATTVSGDMPPEITSYKIAASGAPVCTEVDELHEALLAVVKRDKQWLDSLKHCVWVEGGMKVAVIEELPSENAIHVDKVRVFGAKGSAVGYTINVSLVPEK